MEVLKVAASLNEEMILKPLNLTSKNKLKLYATIYLLGGYEYIIKYIKKLNSIKYIEMLDDVSTSDVEADDDLTQYMWGAFPTVRPPLYFWNKHKTMDRVGGVYDFLSTMYRHGNLKWFIVILCLALPVLAVGITKNDSAALWYHDCLGGWIGIWLPSIFDSQRYLVAKSHQSVDQFVLSSGSSYVVNTNFEDQVRAAILRPLSGVQVVLAPQGSGKTTIISKVSQELVDDCKIDGVLYVEGNTALGYEDDPTKWLKKELNVPYFASDSFGDLIGKKSNRTLLIIDQVHHLMGNSRMKSFVIGLGERSQKSRDSFVVVLLVSDASTASTILSWNGNEKIRKSIDVTAKWHRDQLITLHQKLNKMSELRELSEKELRVVFMAGTPGVLLDIMQSDMLSSRDFGLVQAIAYDKCRSWCFGDVSCQEKCDDRLQVISL